jgi:hypothetical protein
MRILLSVLLLLAFLPDYSGDARLALPDSATPTVSAAPVLLDWRDPARRRLGALTFLGGVHLSSDDRAFGGFSAMVVTGDRFILLSDGGNALQFRLDARWRLYDVRFTPLPDGPGSGWAKYERDSESLTIDPATGRLWVGFELANAIWRYAPGLARAQAHAAPPAMAKWSDNSGAESMARLRDGSFVVISEGGGTIRKGLWFAGDPVRQPRRGFAFGYRAPDGYRPVDIAELPDGRLVVLNRRASLADGFTAVVTLLERKAIRPGRIARGREIARFAAPVVHDNFEGIAAVREGKDTILWIVSDDNQYFFQRSLLLKFRLEI